MRADRLLSMLMLLQNRGRMTARELAEELEVTERTVYRDVNALSFSGVPVYAERGPGGGISLIESYRSDLTGLNKDEVQALFMLSIPPALTELGLDQKFRAAMLKLSAALPKTMRGDEQRVRQRIHIDPTPYKPNQPENRRSHLSAIYQAVWDSRVIEMKYIPVLRPDLGFLTSFVNPYGLVAKAGDWYLVAQRRDHRIVLQLKYIHSVKVLDEQFERPVDFDLIQYWENWCRENEANRPSYPVQVRVAPQVVDKLSSYFGQEDLDAVSETGKPDSMGWITLEIQFSHLEDARRKLLGLGGAVEVIEPLSLRYSVQDYAEQIVAVYTQSPNSI